MSASHPKIDMERLRAIGWRHWDPLSLSDGEVPDGGWADEYDDYLLKVAGMVRRGEDLDAAAQYLLTVETDRMSMETEQSDRLRARQTVKAIQADTLLWSDQRNGTKQP